MIKFSLLLTDIEYNSFCATNVDASVGLSDGNVTLASLLLSPDWLFCDDIILDIASELANVNPIITASTARRIIYSLKFVCSIPFLNRFHRELVV